MEQGEGEPGDGNLRSAHEVFYQIEEVGSSEQSWRGLPAGVPRGLPAVALAWTPRVGLLNAVASPMI